MVLWVGVVCIIMGAVVCGLVLSDIDKTQRYQAVRLDALESWKDRQSDLCEPQSKEVVPKTLNNGKSL